MKKSGYEQTYEMVRSKLVNCDFEAAVKRLGFEQGKKGRVAIDFLGRRYEIDENGVEPVDGKPVQVNNLSVLVYYVTSKGEGAPEGTYRLPHYFIRGMATSSDGTGIGWMNAPLVRAYGEDVAKLHQVMEELGAVLDPDSNETRQVWFYRLLPKMPVQLVYLKADEEFPCEIRILFDQSASRFLEFEPLAFLQGCFVKTLLDLGREEKSRGGNSI